MRKLLSANFSRLWKDKVFWLCMGAMFAYAVGYMLIECRVAARDTSAYTYTIDAFYFRFAITIGAFCALFSSMFLGMEYSDGTIRNKIVLGHTRARIYLANSILVFTAALLIMFAWCIGALVALPTLGVWKMGIPNLLLYLLISVLFVAALSSIFTFVGMLSASKSATVAISIFLFLGLLLFAAMIDGRLNEPEMTSGVALTANGLEWAEPEPNPAYVSGVKRTVYQFIVDFLPTGQCLEMTFMKITHPIRMLVSSVCITIGTTVAGIFIFKRKNLK